MFNVDVILEVFWARLKNDHICERPPSAKIQKFYILLYYIIFSSLYLYLWVSKNIYVLAWLPALVVAWLRALVNRRHPRIVHTSQTSFGNLSIKNSKP